jgi:hypothetical protein
MHDGVGALERTRPDVGVADIPPDYLYSKPFQVLGHVILAVKLHVNRGYLNTGRIQLRGGQSAEIAGRACQAYMHANNLFHSGHIRVMVAIR